MTITLLCMLGVFIAGCAFGWISEAYSWNKGICRENGLPWIYFDTDSQGGRGYKAGDCTTWISWPADHKRRSA